ncbi:MAG: CsbD family protein [Actinomycetota bacterium]|nr:CsbD family protein [Actinomycetota bacterium]
MSKAKGKIKEAAGWLTADRKAEAEGKVEQAAADPADATDEVTERAVAEETDAVREDYGELVEPSEAIDAPSD